jgi:parallel beta-helix repeat protein
MRKMPKKEKKKSWKEIQRERQIKQQRVQEAYQIQKEREVERKPRKWPKGKIFAAVCLLVLILGVYGAWQLIQSSAPIDATPTPSPVIPTGAIIYISFDGQVSPSTAPISNDGNGHYTLTGDLYNSLIIGKDNIVIDGANHVIQGTDAYDSRGIDLTGRSKVTITNVKIKGFDYGVYLSSASNNVISQNDLTSNYCGIWIAGSSNNNVISGNNMVNNNMYAIWLKESSNNKISENEITSHANYTIYIRDSDGTTISANNIEKNRLGIFLYESSNNILYHNNFIDNGQAFSSVSSTSVLNSGSPSEGNYWSDYKERYSNATEVDSSGIWNTPYVVDESNQIKDNYPLVNPWILD